MIVVSDTTAITSLIRIDRVELLSEIFGSIIIPPAVQRELLAFHPGLPKFITVQAAHDERAVLRLRQEVGLGESEAIALAQELHADALLIDERRGRAVALREGVPVIGLVGALLLAKRRGILLAIGPVLDALEQGADFRISADLKTDALRSAGE